MTARKKRILFSNESSFLPTGFSTYGLEMLRRWHATGKYELMEFGTYGEYDDPRCKETPWQYMCVTPNPRDKRETDAYNSSPTNQFGEWKFEQACLTFRPDIVIDIRDWWHLEHEERSSFRPYYHWAIMPTVDGAPQDENWIATFMDADAVFTYTDWALELLREQSNGKIKLKSAASPGADMVTMQMVPDKRAHRDMMGIDPDCFIVGTIMRNQVRKLYPDLVEAFALFLKTAPEEMAKKTFLYLHCGWPDVGWDIPRLIKEAGVAHRTVFTYYCRGCGANYPSFFSDARTCCKRCGEIGAAGMTDSKVGVSRKDLNNVLNLFDVYVQYANSEGFGMPQVEAAACGVPVMAVDYSGMSDVVRKIKGTPINVERFVREPATHVQRALPDNADFVRKLIDFFNLPMSVRLKKGFETRRACQDNYDYDKTAKIWESHFDSVQCRDHKDTWLSPQKIHVPNMEIPQGLSNEQLVRWGMLNIAGRPDLVDSYMAMRMARDLNWGCHVPHFGRMYQNEMSTLSHVQKFEEFLPKDAINAMLGLCERRNLWEERRAQYALQEKQKS